MGSNAWYHPNLSNVEAERLLKEKGEDGGFLVRPSQSAPGQFSLSVRQKDKVSHFKIKRDHGGDAYSLQCGDHFKTLTQLVKYYIKNQLKLTDKDKDVFELKWPLKFSKSPTERWFHGSISGAEAEETIIRYGVNGSFLVRESQSHLGGYVLTVRTKDELSQADKVTHVMIRYHDDKYDVGGGKKFATLTDLVEHYKRNPMVETTGTVVNMKCPFNTTRFTASDIDARVNELSKDSPESTSVDGFWEEFEQLQNQEARNQSCFLNRKRIAQSGENKLKNRYKFILPYDHTLVKLSRPKSSLSSSSSAFLSHNGHNKDNNISNFPSAMNAFNLSASATLDNSTITGNDKANDIGDYINASYIKLVDDGQIINSESKPVQNSKVYIATQGPLPNTVNDFWWMVWQEKSECIVMLTKEVERGKNKCYRYWPTPNQKILKSSPLEIEILSENYVEDYVIRGFEIRFYGNECQTSKLRNSSNSHQQQMDDCVSKRRVVQYHYLAWPDHSIPSTPQSIIGFLKTVNTIRPDGPMIVHCCAGIGRSGTLIVIDMLIDQLKHNGLGYEIDIYQLVNILRAQRFSLVQTVTQYEYIYFAIQNYINSLKKLSTSDTANYLLK